MNKEFRRLGQYIFSNHDFDGTVDDFLAQTAPLIGYVVHNFNALDEQLNRAICERINDRTDEPGAIVIHRLTFAAKVDLFSKLVRSMEIIFGEEIPVSKTLIEHLRKCATLRNSVVHAEWENMNDKGYTYVKMTFDSNGMQQHYWQFTPESLKNIIDFIQETYCMFDQYEESKGVLFTRSRI